ncbi:MAG: DUF1080 domain-containing protein [Bacteroidales bacterium]|nr:DUF1080 domain-containing protein [Bacteroidales bacterium]
MKKIIFTIAFGAAISFSSCNNSDWQPLFNGKDFKGFVQLNGKAQYIVENGEMVGISTAGTPNSFMCTEKEYSDFILEFEVKVDSLLNSGVQIRSHSFDSIKNGRVFGYQVEIDPSARAWSGGIYDEARRAWLYPVTPYNAEAIKAFDKYNWNKYRIEAIGNRIRTWVNGIPTADMIDDADASGFIAFQVHQVPDEHAGLEVRWKNIRIVTENLEKYKTDIRDDIYQINLIPNTLSELEQKEGWKLLFDGVTSANWRGAHKEVFPDSGWIIEDGILTVLPSGGAESKGGGDIVTTQEFGNFILSFEFMITEGANSGVKYFVTENYETSGSAIGLEYQIIDDLRNPDAKMGHEGNRTLASLYDLIPAAENKQFNGIGKWNTGRIVSLNNHTEHWLNGSKVLEYQRGSEEYLNLVQESKYKGYDNFGLSDKGHILLQDHGDKVSFRSIKIRELQ